MPRRILGVFAVVAATALFLTVPSQAEEPWSWPEKPEH